MKGRPRCFDETLTLQVLMRLFWEKGYEATTQKDMMEASGLSSSSLLNTFGSKAELFQRVLDEYLATQLHPLVNLKEGEAGLLDLDRFLERMESHLLGQSGFPSGCLAVKTLTGPCETAKQFAPLLKRHRMVLSEHLEAVLLRAAALQEIPIEEVTEKRELLLATLLGILAVAGNDPDGSQSTPMLRALRKSLAA